MHDGSWKQQCKRNWKKPHHWWAGLVLGFINAGLILEAAGQDGEWAFLTAAYLVLIPLALAWLLLAIGAAVGLLGGLLDCLFGSSR